MNAVNIDEKLAQIAEPWQPHVVGQVNDSLVKLVKFKESSSGIITAPRTRCSSSFAARSAFW
jgi:hypothetical protein